MLGLLGLILGFLFGCLTGLIPGLHVNLIATLIFAIYSLPLELIVSMAISMGITHSFVSAIPSIFLGAPEESTVLAALPGHKMLLKGEGYFAAKLTAIGSLAALLLGALLMPFFIFSFPILYSKIKKFLWLILILIVFLLILKEQGIRKILAILVFISSGLLGILTLNKLKEPLLPMLSGLFGVATIIYALAQKSKLPIQRNKGFYLNKKETIISTLVAIFSGGIITLFPSLGPSQAAALSRIFLTKFSDKGYLIAIGGISTADFLISLATLFAIGKARNGIAVAIQRLVESFTLSDLIFMLLIAIAAGVLAFFATLFLSKLFAKFISKINYKIINAATIIFIFALVFAVTGFVGILVLIASTLIGLLPIVFNCNRSHAMGCLILPTIIFYFKASFF